MLEFWFWNIRKIILIFRGSFAVVKEGEHKATRALVAIKIIEKQGPENLEEQEVIVSRFMTSASQSDANNRLLLLEKSITQIA